MKRTTFKICFYIQKSRIAKDGQAPILLRVTVNGQRSVTSVNLKVNPKNWNAVVGKSIANTRMDDELNARLDTIRLRIMQIYREMELNCNQQTLNHQFSVKLNRHFIVEAVLFILLIYWYAVTFSKMAFLLPIL